jgi:hypothetical protein
MSFAEIEAELDRLSADQLRRLALKSWTAFMQKEGRVDAVREVSEDDPELLAALDDAIAEADAAQGQGHSGAEVRARLEGWISK